LWEVDEHSLGETLQIVLNSVLHDIINVNDKLLKLGKTAVNMAQVAINVHGGPGEGHHTWSKLVLKILQVWYEERLSVWSDLVDDSVVFSEDKLKLVVVHVELIFLQKDDLGALWDINTNSSEALGFSNKGKDLRVEVDVKLVVLWVTDNESGLKSSLSLLDFGSPLLSPKVLEGEESVTNLVVHLDVLLGLSGLDEVLWELLHWS